MYWRVVVVDQSNERAASLFMCMTAVQLSLYIVVFEPLSIVVQFVHVALLSSSHYDSLQVETPLVIRISIPQPCKLY